MKIELKTELDWELYQDYELTQPDYKPIIDMPVEME